MADAQREAEGRAALWRDVARQLRVDSIRCSTAAGSGHPTSSLSAADLVAVLICDHLRYDFATPKSVANDRLIFSKGHASPLCYAMLKAAGAIRDDELMSFRKLGSRMQGHPTPEIPWVDVATGSLGQGLPIAVGVALAARLEKAPYRVWVLHGDSEMAEGSVWEGFDKAGHYQLGNLTVILDMNRLGQRGPTSLGWDSSAYAARARAFGWHAVEIDGHDVAQVDRAYREAAEPRRVPTLIVAKTRKGRGVSFAEDKDGWHGKALSKEQAAQAIAELGGDRPRAVRVPRREEPVAPLARREEAIVPPRYQVGDKVATRMAYGEGLRAVGAARSDVVALDGEVSNSTYSEIFGKAFPERFFEMFIAEQQMVAAAVGFQVRGFAPFASTFAAFLTRAYDFIRMAAVSRADIRLCGSHAGVSIGEDGPSQMALEDLAMMRAVYGSTVLYPCDPNQTAALVAAMADRRGVSYLRTTREKTPVIYPPGTEFPVGGSRVVRRSDADRVAVVAAGVTVHEALEAARKLGDEGVAVRVIDAYSVKPFDAATLREAVRATGRLVVVEDHYPEGGLGSAALEALARGEKDAGPVPMIEHLCVRIMPGSGTPKEMLAAAGIDAAAIAAAVRRLI